MQLKIFVLYDFHNKYIFLYTQYVPKLSVHKLSFLYLQQSVTEIESLLGGKVCTSPRWGRCWLTTLFRRNLVNEIEKHSDPAIIYEDNEGAIVLAKNQQVSMRTKHIDVRAHFIRDCIKNWIEIKKVMTNNNVSDIMTKNCDVTTFLKHIEKILEGKIECDQHVEGTMSDWL